MKISLPRDVACRMRAAAEAAYPHEACGLLVGKEGHVVRVHAVVNQHRDRLGDRYEVDPRDYLRIEKQARAEGLSVIGFYHSHPELPSRPSARDTELAWPRHFYTILSVRNRAVEEVQTWLLPDREAEWEEVPMEVT